MNKTVSGAALASVASLLYVLGTHNALAPEAQRGLACPGPAEAANVPLETLAEPNPEQRALIDHLSRRFTIATQAAERVVEAAYDAAHVVALDPLLLLAVIAVESRFNPFAESPMGAKGLMQIIPRYHRDKFAELGGEAAVLEPEANIQAGAQILQEYVYRTGSLEAGLQYYNGALADGSAQYAQKILAERERLELVARPRPQLASTSRKGS
jgi:soluble lytic murein transglycosylase-like protein